jgi:hypothetical protein
MSKEQIILDVYREHCLEQSKYLRHGGTIQEFIDKCKTNPEFSEKWGLKIEERELSLEERYQLMKNGDLDEWLTIHYKEPKTMEYMDKHNVPTKLITITYNDKTIESYE